MDFGSISSALGFGGSLGVTELGGSGKDFIPLSKLQFAVGHSLLFVHSLLFADGYAMATKNYARVA